MHAICRFRFELPFHLHQTCEEIQCWPSLKSCKQSGNQAEMEEKHHPPLEADTQRDLGDKFGNASHLGGSVAPVPHPHTATSQPERSHRLCPVQ